MLYNGFLSLPPHPVLILHFYLTDIFIQLIYTSVYSIKLPDLLTHPIKLIFSPVQFPRPLGWRLPVYNILQYLSGILIIAYIIRAVSDITKLSTYPIRRPGPAVILPYVHTSHK